MPLAQMEAKVAKYTELEARMAKLEAAIGKSGVRRRGGNLSPGPSPTRGGEDSQRIKQIKRI
jgi:hypothetical protein